MEFADFQRQIRDGLVPERLMAMLSGFFGLLAAVLAMVGLYGVISYIVERRRSEIGIRLALGAERGQVVGMVMRDAGNCWPSVSWSERRFRCCRAQRRIAASSD